MVTIGCAGILVADMFCGPLDALPQPGELLAVDDIVARAGGCAANVAIGVTKQGFDAQVCGCVGDDAQAQIVLNALVKASVDVQHITVTPDFPTSQTVILLIKGEDRRYIHVFGANSALSVAHIPYNWLETLDIFYVGGLFAMPALQVLELREALKHCRDNHILTVVDVVIPHLQKGLHELDQLLPYVDYFLPNDTEAENLTQQADPMDQIRTLREHGANRVIITQGEHGALAMDGDEYWQIGAFHVDTVDPSGSGDAFAAGIITGAAQGWDMQRTLQYATALGASCTLKIGTTDGVFTQQEVNTFLKTHNLPIRRLSE